MSEVYLLPCQDYDEERVKSTLRALMDESGGLDFIKPNMKIAIKANLVSHLKPEKAATTHPTLVCALCDLIVERGATPIVGDSPGGLYTSAFVNRIYNETGMHEAEKHGAILNQNFEQKFVENPDGMVLKSFAYTSWLDECDAIINFCKLKSHGMIGMSAAAKNMFGVIPGVTKPEYHVRFPDPRDFARMIIDIDEYFKPQLSIVDAIVGMEGNGPTAGTPRHIGVLLTSKCPHKLDLVCANLIGLSLDDVPTLQAAKERGLVPNSVDELSVSHSIEEYIVHDYHNLAVRNSLLFAGKNETAYEKIKSKFISKVLSRKPKLKSSECVGCAKCAEICPAKAIVMKNKKAIIDRKKCIKCFCCQEFCPKGAMKVHRTLIAKIINGKST